MLIHLWSIVGWWDEWQLRILVLGSLGLQWFLLVAAPMRKYTIPQWFRKCIWLAYVSSDALAVYALATLFNRHSKASSHSSCGGDINGGQAGVLEILWAPVLLIHLGGQMELTAYNIEDNELWMRHTVTLVSQVAVAVYAFYKSWPNSTDKRLWAAAVLLFIIGVLSFSEKPWAFRRARIQRLAAVSSLIQQGRRRDEGKWEKAYRFCFTDIEEQMLKKEKAAGGQGKVMSKRNRLHMIMSDMSLFAAESELKRRHAMKMKRMSQGGGDDDDQGSNVEVLEVLTRAERFSKPWLRKAFRLIYTRANVMWTPAYLAYHLLLVPALHLAAITLFAVSHKRGRYNPTDVKTTYVLLFFTAALDVFALFFRATLYYLMDVAKVPSLCEWIAQYNLIDAALRRLEPATGWLVKCAACFGCHEDYFACFKRDELYSKVAGYLIVDLFKSSDHNIKGLDLGNYRNFDTVKEVEVVEEGGEVRTTTRTVKAKINADDTVKEVEVVEGGEVRTTTRTVKAKINADNWALTKELRDKASTEVRSSLLGSFDRSVLLWHIATDLCFCLNPPTAPTNPREVITEAISNYMAHLLNFRPDMLLTGSRRHLFVEAMEQVEDILGEDNRLRTGRHLKHLIDDRALVETIFLATLDEHGCRDKDTCDSNNTSSPPKYALVHDACRLAKQLLRLEKEDEDTRYELMYRVWLGMLFYSAAMCRGYQHAKSLGEGGEFLSFIWLLLSIKGCKTLSDKLQMPDEPDSGDHQETQDTPWPEVNLREQWAESA